MALNTHKAEFDEQNLYISTYLLLHSIKIIYMTKASF